MNSNQTPIDITINTESCTRCGRCAKVCPSMTLLQHQPGGQITIESLSSCTVCGHCLAACPTSSVVHSRFRANAVHPIDRELLPSPEQMMMLIKSRRSNRAFTKQPIAQVSLDMILQAAHRAPTARNAQMVSFTLVTDPEKIAAVSRFTLDTFTSLARKLGNPFVKPLVRIFMPAVLEYLPAFQRMEAEYLAGNDLILRGATALIFIHSTLDNRFLKEDTNLAYQNGSLMAESLSISQFYTGFVLTAAAQRKGKLEELLGIEGVIGAGMALGHTSFTMCNYIDRNKIKINE